MNKKIVGGLVLGVLAFSLVMPTGRVMAQTGDATIQALQKQVSQLLELIKNLQAQINALGGGVTPGVKQPIITPWSTEPERGWDTVTGVLQAQGADGTGSIQMWGTHKIVSPSLVEGRGGWTRLVKAVNDDVLVELKKYEGQNVTLWGQLQYQNLEGGFWGFVAKKVYGGATTCSLPVAGTKIGYQDESVKVVQEVLKTDKSVYPEGLVTGYYGPLTARAVTKFQTKVGLPATGVLDTETKERIEAKLVEGSTGAVAPTVISIGPVEPPIIRCPIPPTPIPPPTPDQGFKVYSPSAGETWVPGQTFKIAWSQIWPTFTGEIPIGRRSLLKNPSVVGESGSTGVSNTTFAPIGAVRITLHRYIACLYTEPRCLIAEAMPYVISEKTDNDGVFEWAIPADIAEQYQGKMIITVSAIDGGFSGRSAVFVIGSNVLPDNQVKVYSPSAGETWYKGKTYEVKWTSPIERSDMVRLAGTVKIALGQSYNYPPCYAEPCPATIAAPIQALYTINANAPDTGSFKWTIPNDLPSGYVSNNMVIYISVNGTDLSGQSGKFAIVESSGSNLPPVVTGVSGPTSLKVGETGTWTVKAYDPENGSLSYSVVWGDEPPTNNYLGAAPKALSIQNTATFSHVFNAVGTYTQVFYVTDNVGQMAKTSMTVVIQ